MCLGKTFADLVGKCVVPGLLCHYELEFQDKKMYDRKVDYNADIMKEPIVMVKLLKSSLNKI